MTHWVNEDGSRYRMFGDRLDPWDERDNPYWILNKNSYQDKTERFTGSINVRADITKWLFVNYRLGIDTYNTVNSTRVAPEGAIQQAWQKGMMGDNTLKYSYLSNNLMINASHSIGDFHGNVMVGMATDDISTDRNYKMAWNFEVPDFYSYANATNTNKKFQHSSSKKRLVGVFGEIRLDWKNTVFLSATNRNDWTSTLPVENRSYYYPSVSGSFVFSQLLQDTGAMSDDILSFGKIRASWAKVGKDTDPYETNTALWPVGSYLGDKTGVGATWTRGNPYLVPEMSKSSEVGLELHFFQHRLKLDVAYYTNDSYNQILSPRGPQSTGYIFCSINAGNVYNRGVEFSLSGTPVERKDFVWESALNVAGNRGTMDGLPDGMDVMYVTDVQYGSAKAASFSGGHFMAISGTKWMRDDDGNIVLDSNNMPLKSDATSVEVGNREAKLTGGWNNTFTYKNLSFNMLWEFRIGGDVFNGTKYAMTQYGTSQFSADVRKQALTLSGVHQILNDKKEVIGYTDPETYVYEPDQTYDYNNAMTSGYNIIKNYYTGAYNYETSNWITKVNSLRLRTLSLTYKLPKRLLEKSKVIKMASVSAVANNLLLFTNYEGDPEVAASGAGRGGSSSVGFDYCGVPAVSSFTFGVNLTF